LAASAAAGTSASPNPATASTAIGTTARRIIVLVCLPLGPRGYSRQACETGSKSFARDAHLAAWIDE
jgi:hypothetical protein